MAVTLTSTGITFSDGTNLDSAPTAGGLNYQVFNSSGTWNHSTAGSPTSILTYGQGGSGAKRPRYQEGYSQRPNGPGTSGGAFVAEPQTVSSNVGVTIGAGAATGTNFCGFYNYGCKRTKEGGTTTVGGVSVNGGPAMQAAGEFYSWKNVDTSRIGSSNSVISVGAGKRQNASDNSNNFAGLSGKAIIVW